MANGSIMPFRPTGTVSVAATAGSTYVALAGGGDSVVVTNTTSSLAYVRFGSDENVVATVADMPVLPNARIMLGVNSIIGYAAVVLATGAGGVLLTRGDGSYL
jgi:H2-forming N5,N10-methylenetetrahydromethanopterin dehydrogenase-like enzyme